MPSRSAAGIETWARPAAISAVTSSSLTPMPRRFASCPSAQDSMSPSATRFLKPIARSWDGSAPMPRRRLDAVNQAVEMQFPFTSAMHWGPLSDLIDVGPTGLELDDEDDAERDDYDRAEGRATVCSRGLQRGGA